MTPVLPNEITPIVVDIEASGFGSGSYPIEIGFAMPDNVRHCYLIKPAPHWQHWSAEAEKVHKISRNTLFQHGVAIDLVAAEINQLLAGKTIYSDAWSYDSSWLLKLFDEADQIPRFQVETIIKLLSHEELSRWDQARAEVEANNPMTRHRASADAHIIQLTYLHLKSHQIVK